MATIESKKMGDFNENRQILKNLFNDENLLTLFHHNLNNWVEKNIAPNSLLQERVEDVYKRLTSFLIKEVYSNEEFLPTKKPYRIITDILSEVELIAKKLETWTPNKKLYTFNLEATKKNVLYVLAKKILFKKTGKSSLKWTLHTIRNHQQYLEYFKEADGKQKKNFEKYYTNTFNWANTYIGRNGGSYEDAKEVTQEVIAILTGKFLSNSQFVLEIPLLNFTKSIIINRWLAYLKSNRVYVKKKYRKKEQEKTNGLKYIAIDKVALENLPFEEMNIENEEETISLITRILQNPKHKKCKDILIQKFLNEKNNEILRKEFQLSSTNAVSVKVSRCLKKLRKTLTQFGYV